MALLKYWDERSSSWRQIGGAVDGSGYVALSGDTITGDLAVDSGDPWEMHVGTRGTLRAGSIRTPPGGVFDGNIRLSIHEEVDPDGAVRLGPPRTVDLGGARAQRASDPIYEDSAATKRYIDASLSGRSKGVSPVPGEAWRLMGDGYGAPRYRLASGGGFVVLEGLLVATKSVSPGLERPEMFVLQEGYRPQGMLVFMVVGGADSLYTCSVEVNGTVRLHSGTYLDAGQYISLDGCRFPVQPAGG